MAYNSSQPQFRYTQPPSKVLHLRNLPCECGEEELIEFGKPFGIVVNTKCNVGANRNQAFIEFAEPNQAIAMMSYYASSPEPAQVRGKTVYLQYSNRQEIVNNKTAADVTGNVLLVTIEGNDARLVSIDVLHLMFSAFGFVYKLTTFEKTAGFQALVQFSDSETASSSKDSLDGRSIPRYLIPELGPCSLRITYSAHAELSVKFQSHRSRVYTNPLLPIAPSAIDANGQMFRQAVVAKEALEGRCIYDGGFCKLHLSYSRHVDLSIKVNNDRSRDYTIPSTPVLNTQHSILGQQPYPAGGPGPHFYSGAQYASAPAHAVPSHSAGWNPTMPQSIPMQMHNYPCAPATSTPALSHGMISPHGQNGLPMPPYHHQ